MTSISSDRGYIISEHKTDSKISKLELILAFATGIFAISAFFIKGISVDTGYIVGTIGALLTISAISLRMELNSLFNNNIEIYGIIDRIHDEESVDRGKKIIEDCKHNLRELEKGIIKLESEEVFGMAIKRMDKLKKSSTLKATQNATTPELLCKWRKETNLKWLEANKNAIIEKKVHIQRVFIIDRNNAFDENHVLNEIMKKILDEQKNDGIDVKILLKEEVPDYLFRDVSNEDFAIFDSSVVQIQMHNRLVAN